MASPSWASEAQVGEVWMGQEGEVARDILFLTPSDFSGSSASPKSSNYS